MLCRPLFILFISLLGCVNTAGQTGMYALLPVEDEIEGWSIGSRFAEINDADLDSLFSTEADLYSEYGFRDGILASLQNSEGDDVSIEIIRMKDSFGAYAVYLANSEPDAESYHAGKNAFISDSSLGFWKFQYFILINSRGTGIEKSEIMKETADVIDSRIRPAGKLPDLALVFNNRPGRVTLLRGKYSLARVYPFTTLDVFRIEEGVALETPGRAEIWLKYSDIHKPVQRLGEVGGVLSRDPGYSGFMMSGDQSFRLYDHKGNAIEIEASGKYLKIVIATVTTIRGD